MTQRPNSARKAAQFAEEVRALPVPASASAAFLEVLKRFDGARISAEEIDRAERLAAAVRMLDAGNPRAIVRDRLVTLYGVTRRTSNRTISEALAKRRPWPGETRIENGTRDGVLCPDEAAGSSPT